MMTEEKSSAPADVPIIQDYTSEAARYDERRYVSQVDSAHESRRRAVLRGMLPEHAPRAADIACGTGRGLAVLQDRATQVIGVDGTFAMLQQARAKRGLTSEVIQANAAQLPFVDGSLDLVVCLNFLHLFPEVAQKRAFVGEMGRTLKRGGVLVVEFDNALQGLAVGGLRKYFGTDIGYDWPWQIRRCFPDGLFASVTFAGANLPFVWRAPLLRRLDGLTGRFPLKYLATRIFVQAVRR